MRGVLVVALRSIAMMRQNSPLKYLNSDLRPQDYRQRQIGRKLQPRRGRVIPFDQERGRGLDMAYDDR